MVALASHLLPVLVLLSGFCGIAYEILYTKLLGNLLGNQFTISASVLLTFLLGIGLGTLYAHRFARQLWLIEGAIGAYAALMVLSYGWIDQILYTHLPGLGTSLPICALVSITLLAVPSFFVGCSVPLFAAYLGTVRSTHVFSLTYGIYNLGAAVTALTVEFVLLRVVGLKAATLCLSMVNGVVAVGLLLLIRSTGMVPAPKVDRLQFARRDLAALAVASIASAAFQLVMIKVAECILGPFNETFSLVLVVVFVGLGLGSLATAKLRLSLAGALLVVLGGLALLIGTLSWMAALYASIYPPAVTSYPLLVSLKLGLVLAMMGIPAIGFGATIPALLREHRDVARESGELLFVSSIGNVAGFALVAFVLHRSLDYGPLLVLVCALSVFALLLHAGPRRWHTWAAVVLFVVAVAAQRGLWNESLLYYGYNNFHSTKVLEKQNRSFFNAEERFKGHQDVFAITRRNGKLYFFINGYNSIALTNASERIVGALSAMFAPRTDRALVLGLGSGATAGTVALIFDKVDVVEINPVVVANQGRMARYNFDIESRSNVNIVTDDGIHFVKTTPARYALILNTVTSPLYFSSAKLYTRDFFADVSKRLTPDGVYTTWIDRKIGDRGVDIILATLQSVFDECWVNYLRSSYYLMACSNGPIRPRQIRKVTSQPELRRFLASAYSFPSALLPYSVLSVDAFSWRSSAATPLNTIDYPVLEHEMASRDSTKRLVKLRYRLPRRLDLKAVARRVAPTMDWNPGAFAWWSALKLNPKNSLARVLRGVIRKEFGDVSSGVLESARQSLHSVGTAAAYKYGHRLYKHGFYQAALPFLAQATGHKLDRHYAHYYKGRCHEVLGDRAAARRHYEAALAIVPSHRKARRALERVRTK